MHIMGETNMLRRFIPFVILYLILPVITIAQEATPEVAPLAVSSIGLMDVNGTALYSVLLHSGEDALNDLTISASVPEGGTFVEPFWMPTSAQLVGEANGVITWSLADLDANSVIGPFTFRVSYEADAEIPANAPASAAWPEGEADAPLTEGELSVYGRIGSITIDSAGTEGLVMVENTGVLMFVQPDTYTEPVTFTFERLPITDAIRMPQSAEATWWCSLFKIDISPAEADAALPLVIFYPTLKTVTPDLPVVSFTRFGDSAWEIVQPNATAKAERARLQDALSMSGVVSPSGNEIIAILIGRAPAPSFEIAHGILSAQRSAGITDGSSNTRSYLEQENLVSNQLLSGFNP
jgi:hypothetical protein